MKKILAIALALMMLLGTAAMAEEAETPMLERLLAAVETLQPSENMYVEDGMTVSAVLTHFNNYPQEFDGTYLWPAIEKLTNIHIDITFHTEDSIGQAIENILTNASQGGKLPDIMNAGNYSGPELYEQGAIVMLDDYLDLIPNIVNAVGEDRMVKWRSADGHIYALPSVVNVPGSFTVMVRQDWLDKLGREVPTTWDEWVDLWRAFRDNDMNGDGDATDEIPLALPQGGNGESSLIPLLNAFGIGVSNDGQFCILDDGTYTMVYEHPRYKEFLEAMRGLYEEHLLDPEFTTRYQNELYTLMDADKVGTVYTWAERCRIDTDTLIGAGVENALWQAVTPITGPHGDQMIASRTSDVSNRWVITTQAEKDGKLENILKFFNWMYSDEGKKLYNYGLEGVSYDVVDGACVLKPEVVADGATGYRALGMQFEPFGGEWLNDAYAQCVFNGKTAADLTGGALSFYNGVAVINNDYFYSMPPTLGNEIYREYHAELITGGVCVARDQCIAGQISVDDFFTQYENFKTRGLADVIKECSDAYNEIMGTK